MESDDGAFWDSCSPGSKIKFLCSYGGRILPRPGDSRLRYVGGETRILGLHRGDSFPIVVSKLAKLCGAPASELSFKYQLLSEDLDALVSVVSQEDLDHMWDECKKLDSWQRLRIFLFVKTDGKIMKRQLSAGSSTHETGKSRASPCPRSSSDPSTFPAAAKQQHFAPSTEEFEFKVQAAAETGYCSPRKLDVSVAASECVPRIASIQQQHLVTPASARCCGTPRKQQQQQQQLYHHQHHHPNNYTQRHQQHHVRAQACSCSSSSRASRVDSRMLEAHHRRLLLERQQAQYVCARQVPQNSVFHQVQALPRY